MGTGVDDYTRVKMREDDLQDLLKTRRRKMKKENFAHNLGHALGAVLVKRSQGTTARAATSPAAQAAIQASTSLRDLSKRVATPYEGANWYLDPDNPETRYKRYTDYAQLPAATRARMDPAQLRRYEQGRASILTPIRQTGMWKNLPGGAAEAMRMYGRMPGQAWQGAKSLGARLGAGIKGLFSR